QPGPDSANGLVSASSVVQPAGSPLVQPVLDARTNGAMHSVWPMQPASRPCSFTWSLMSSLAPAPATVACSWPWPSGFAGFDTSKPHTVSLRGAGWHAGSASTPVVVSFDAVHGKY